MAKYGFGPFMFCLHRHSSLKIHVKKDHVKNQRFFFNVNFQADVTVRTKHEGSISTFSHFDDL